MRSSSFRVSEGRTLLCAKKLIALQGELVVRLHLPTILDFRIRHSLSRFEVLLQTRTDEVLPALTADLITWRFPIACVCNIALRVVLRRRQRKRDGGPFPRIGILHIRFGPCPCHRAGGGILFHIKRDSPAIAAPAEEGDDNETDFCSAEYKSNHVM